MNTTTLLVEISNAVATVTLNRPDRGNAFNQAMLDELGGVLAALKDDAAVRVLILRAAGKHFCTGADVSSRGEKGPESLSFNEVLSRLDRFPKPTIACVQGGCVGGGLGFAACCDVLIADEGAFFSVPELKVGIAPSGELVGLLIRAMGYRAFRRYGLSSEKMPAQDALRLGLAHEVVGPGDLEARLSQLVDAFLHNAPNATAELKRTIAGLGWPAEAAIFPPGGTKPRELERSPEAAEGIQAFKEKRKPSWYAER